MTVKVDAPLLDEIKRLAKAAMSDEPVAWLKLKERIDPPTALALRDKIIEQDAEIKRLRVQYNVLEPEAFDDEDVTVDAAHETRKLDKGVR